LGEYDGSVGDTSIYLNGLIQDALVGLGASLVFAWLFAKSFPLFTNSWLLLSSALSTHNGPRFLTRMSPCTED
jgi:hypothetical protein